MKKKKRKPEMEVLKEKVGPPIEEPFIVEPEETEPKDEKVKLFQPPPPIKLGPLKGTTDYSPCPAPCEHDDVEIGLGGHRELTIRGCKRCRRVEIDLFDPWNHDKGKRPNGDEYNVKRVLRGLVISKGK